MRVDNVPILALLRENMGFNAERQRVIADNVANANTPGYTPQDLDENAFMNALSREMDQARAGGRNLELRTTQANHIAGNSGGGAARTYSSSDNPDSETTVNGNSVVVEEQMVRAQETRMRYESALSLYQKSIGLLRVAIRRPGG